MLHNGDKFIYNECYGNVAWSFRRLKSPVSRLFITQASNIDTPVVMHTKVQ